MFVTLTQVLYLQARLEPTGVESRKRADWLIYEINYLRKKFNATMYKAQWYKMFYGRNLRVFVESSSVCP